MRGGINASVFTMIMAILGAGKFDLSLGTLTLPYVCLENGVIFGSFLLFIGALVSNYAGMRFIECTEKAKSMKYTDFALHLYGPRVSKITGWCIVLCLLGFCISYIVFLKILIP